MKLLSKAFIVTFLLLSNLNLSYGQASYDMNFIIMIDESLVVGSIARPRIIINEKEEIEVDYYPGNLSLKQSDYDRLKEMDNDSMTLAFNYYEYKGQKQIVYNYTLPFFKSWLDHYFMVMRVYNLDKRKYKGVFEPLDKERNYTYELDYPGGQMLRVRNKIKKKKCNCN